MRVIEPKHNSKKSKERRIFLKLIKLTAVIMIISGTYAWYQILNNPSDSSTSSYYGVDSDNTKSTTSAEVEGQQSQAPQLLSGDQYLDFYESLTFPNTQPLDNPPTITGDKRADERIRKIAESRGYQLRSVPILPIIKIDDDNLEEDDLLQPKAYPAWRELKEKAEADGINLVLTSAYRSIDRQRELFLGRLGDDISSRTDLIRVGMFDDEIIQTLYFTSPPGYSRHHTGYTIDLTCEGYNQPFEHTPCFEWLSQDNYQNAKNSGWIPSYPDGVDNQGPKPEPWEYVWVGKEVLR